MAVSCKEGCGSHTDTRPFLGHTPCDTVRRLTTPPTPCNRPYVASASCPQVRVRVVAATTAVWLIVCGVPAARHEATCAPVRDGAGGYMHARGLIGHHQGNNSDIHGQRNP